jgi:hypothetical protein
MINARDVMFSRICAFALCFAIILLSSCSYRMAGIAPLGESVRVVITSNSANVVRVQSYLQSEVAAALENKLGWHVSPTGSAKLELTIDQETINAIGNDTRGIASRWNITVTGNALLTSKHGNSLSRWTGTGYSAGLNDEASALQSAANNAGLTISTWLENWAETAIR